MSKISRIKINKYYSKPKDPKVELNKKIEEIENKCKILSE